MKISLENIDTKVLKESKLIFFLLFLLIPALVFLKNNVNEVVFFSVLFVPFFILLALDFEIIYKILIISFFLNIVIVGNKITVWYCYLVLFSFLITHVNFKRSDFTNPLTKPLLIYVLLCLPSFINSFNLLYSIYLCTGFILLVCLVYILPIYMDEYSKIYSSIFLFLFLSVVNSLHVIYGSYSGETRFFGFCGVLFADYVNIAFSIVLNYLLLKHKNKYLQIILIGLFLVVSFEMQTRNAWITLFVTLSCYFVFLFVNSDKVNINRQKIIISLAAMIMLLFAAFMFASVINPSVSSRVSDLNSGGELISDEGGVSNTLVSRALIWHTAFNAFKAHPIIGVGWCSFSIFSKYYSTLPEILYTRFVANCTAHLGFLAVLTETGIVGLCGFVILLASIIKLSIKSIKIAKTKDEMLISFVSFNIILYLSISLFLTDAWLYSTGLIVWSFFLSIAISNYKILIRKNGENGI